MRERAKLSLSGQENRGGLIRLLLEVFVASLARRGAFDPYQYASGNPVDL